MSETTPPKKTNRIGLEVSSYRGSKTTLCAGCGHNAITERIIDAFYEMGVDPKRVLKLSGIGSKAGGPDYLLQFLLPRTITENQMRRGFAPETGAGE